MCLLCDVSYGHLIYLEIDLYILPENEMIEVVLRLT